MEFLDEDARPRFLFQSKAVTSSATEAEPHYKNLSKPLIAFTVLLSFVLLGLSFFFLGSEPYQSLLIWVALSILVGPFAPPSVTGGDIRVGQGPIVDFPEVSGEVEDESKKRVSQKRQKPRRSDDSGVESAPVAGMGNGYVREERKSEALGGSGNGVRAFEEERDWVEEDVEILKKQLVKNPVGKPRRWEVIAEAFGGRHKVESVIKKAKELGEKKVSDSDSYAEFLKKRKPNEKKIESESQEMGEESNAEGKSGGVSWAATEDIALLNALKAFPKDVSMRWEKIAAAVPGKTKAACIKRVAELKKGFRSAKAATEE
ncbi:transcription factor MAMYB [Rosa rugosa]|uniref:transcription factor MAMYB n=1 Tax=Rosa rugosa TaxID=74645 RepID=UPI002B412733|nr:transcription factor MAMYB [Rosa rugosa]XP_062028390.1 transcription factor MAMYB [Rosa rugosa]XP_062028391.1 transcription factor MAMYB [Rosa rugosa]